MALLLVHEAALVLAPLVDAALGIAAAARPALFLLGDAPLVALPQPLLAEPEALEEQPLLAPGTIPVCVSLQKPVTVPGRRSVRLAPVRGGGALQPQSNRAARVASAATVTVLVLPGDAGFLRAAMLATCLDRCGLGNVLEPKALPSEPLARLQSERPCGWVCVYKGTDETCLRPEPLFPHPNIHTTHARTHWLWQGSVTAGEACGLLVPRQRGSMPLR